MATSYTTRTLRIYRDIFRRHPVLASVFMVVFLGFYGFILNWLGILHIPVLARSTINVFLEPTEVYEVGVAKVASKRIRVIPNSNELIEKMTATVEAPKFTSEIKLISAPTIRADISKFEAPNGRKRFEVLFRSPASQQQLVIVLIGIEQPNSTSMEESETVVVEVVASTKNGRLFGASAIGQFSSSESEEAQSRTEKSYK
jgi:hypothetical protein